MAGPRAPIFRVVFIRLVFVAALVSLFAIAIPGTAAAQSQAAVDKVTNLNKKAIDAFNKQDYETARELLKQALEVCASSGLEKHPIRARTHIHFGIVAIVGFKQREVGLKQFRKALDVQPDIKLTKSLATPELQDAFEEAVLAGEGGGGGGGAAAGGGGGDNAGGGGDDDRRTAEGGGAGDDGDETPKVKRPAPPRKKKGDEEDDKGEGKIQQKGIFFAQFGVGSGFGLVKGSGELDPAMHQVNGVGLATAQLGQLAPELGFFVAPDVLISAQLRVQYIIGLNGKMPRVANTCGTDNFCSPGTTAGAIFGKATYLMLDAPFHLTVGAQVGYGYIRHPVNFDLDKGCASGPGGSPQTCVDTLAGGPFLIGPTFGMLYEIGDSIDFTIAANTALGAPKFTYNFDIDFGIGFRI